MKTRTKKDQSQGESTIVVSKSKKYQLFENLKKKGYPVNFENGMIYFYLQKGDTITEKSIRQEMTAADGTPKFSWGYTFVDENESRLIERTDAWNCTEHSEDL